MRRRLPTRRTERSPDVRPSPFPLPLGSTRPFAIAHRESGTPDFWDVRYAETDHLFGTGPNAFVADAAERLPVPSRVVELGAGEARTLVWLAAQHGHRPTAVDFSAAALDGARRLARAHGVDLETVAADVRAWTPTGRSWDAAIVTFVQLLPAERQRLYRLLRAVVRPGGWILGQWFRPDHLRGNYDRVGPSTEDRMVPVEELRSAFDADRLDVCESRDVQLHEGPFLQGRAACAQLAARRGEAGVPAP